MEQLKGLLLDLGRDAELAARFEEDPDAVLDEYGIPAHATEAVKRGDVDALKALTGLADLHLTNSTIKAYK
ncbi:MAG: hypothetical protein R3323_02390 [Wenzhouxiangellaceae bacterium]|nr:hypothetical protein [Wenzhouxiangellaceae bacterium]